MANPLEQINQQFNLIIQTIKDMDQYQQIALASMVLGIILIIIAIMIW